MLPCFPGIKNKTLSSEQEIAKQCNKFAQGKNKQILWHFKHYIPNDHSS